MEYKLEKKFNVDGSDKNITVIKIKAMERNRLFSKYLNLNKFMKEKQKNKDANMLDYIKDDESLLDFMFDVIKNNIAGINFDDLSSETADKLFNEYGTFILGGDSKN